jgi:GT2 family glycosyltransferase
MKNSLPLSFSVVIPVYNRASTVLPTLLSIKNQTYSNFECIIIDDGSKDSKALIAVIENLHDDRFQYLRQTNAGSSAARNTGIKAAKGKYIAFLDSDDQFLPNKLERFENFISVYGGDAWYSQSILERGTSKTWLRPKRELGRNEDVGEYLFLHNQHISTCTMVVIADVAKTVLFNPNAPKMQDPDFCLRLQGAGIRFKMIPEPLTIWNDQQSAGRISMTKTKRLDELYFHFRPMLSPLADIGFKALVLAPEIGLANPRLSLKYLLDGLLIGRMPARVLFRQFLRTILPWNVYRVFANFFISLFGKSK